VVGASVLSVKKNLWRINKKLTESVTTAFVITSLTTTTKSKASSR
jgi:hypothetical protein